MTRVLTTLCCAALCATPILAWAAPPKMTPQQFVDFAAQTDMVEANLGQYAQNAAASDKVKDYGQMLVTDHTKDYSQLYAAAQKDSLTVPKAIDTKNNATMIAPMYKLNGKAFDKMYIANMIKGHTKAVETYKEEIATTNNADIKAYAQASLPVVEKHLDDAKKLEKSGI